MLQSRTPPTVIYTEDEPDTALPFRTGRSVSVELGGRLLVRYLRLRDVVAPSAAQGSPKLGGLFRPAWVTPTPFSPREAIAALALPFPRESRTHAVLLNPALIPLIQGPRRISCGTGIEYLLPQGYPAEALAFGWELEVR
jgi:hypothetical protein